MTHSITTETIGKSAMNKSFLRIIPLILILHHQVRGRAIKPAALAA
jgi:hypothetical protein